MHKNTLSTKIYAIEMYSVDRIAWYNFCYSKRKMNVLQIFYLQSFVTYALPYDSAKSGHVKIVDSWHQLHFQQHVVKDCGLYHTEVFPLQRSRAEWFVRTLGLKYFVTKAVRYVNEYND